jgi:glycosyltransferase involved in cell wall biosynthesis
MIPLIYALQNGNLYGPQRMALATLDGLRGEFKPFIFAHEGAVISEARKMGFDAQSYKGAMDFAMKLRRILAEHQELRFFATELFHSKSMIWLNTFYRRKVTHLNIVSGCAANVASYKKRSKLDDYDVTFVTHHEFIKERLIARGARQEHIRVIENFLSEKRKADLPRKLPFKSNGVKKVFVISQLEPMKRVDLLLDALDLLPSLSSLEFTIFGNGSQFEQLKKRATQNNPNVNFAGFDENVATKLPDADLFLNFCPVESTGLGMLEAMASNVPVLVSDGGETGSAISHNVNGFTFRANDAAHLGQRLGELSKTKFDQLNAIVKGAKHLLNIRFSPETSIEKYRRTLTEQKSEVIDLTRGKLIL